MKSIYLLIMSMVACIAQPRFLIDDWILASIPAPAGMTMTNIPGAETNCIAWYRGDSYDGTAGTWTNLSSFGQTYTLTNLGASTTKPTLVASTLNGLPGLTFDGGDHLQNVRFTNSQPTDIFAVCSITNEGTAIHLYSANASYRHAVLNDVGGLGMNAGTALASFATWTNRFMVFRFLFNGASSSMQTNAVTRLSGNAGTENISGITVGNRSTFTVPSKMSMLELVYFNKALDANSASNVNYVLTNRYAISQP